MFTQTLFFVSIWVPCSGFCSGISLELKEGKLTSKLQSLLFLGVEKLKTCLWLCS